MRDIAIVIAEEEAGLHAAVQGTGYKIIPDTIHQFKSLTTISDPKMKQYGTISTGEPGWIACAEYQN